MKIGNREIAIGKPTYIVAELSANHNQYFDRAVQLVRAAKECGADAVKLQTYTADTITIRSDRPEFRIASGTLWDGRTLHDLYQEAHTPWEWHPRLQATARELGMDFFSTAFDPTAVDFLEGLDVPVHKIASFELVDIPLIRKMARTGKPLILSTGMGTLGEVAEAVEAAREEGAVQIALLKCTSTYPAPPDDMDLRTIPHMAETFQVPVGLSDHTLDTAAAVVAVALGACIVEKHLTLSRSDPGPDSTFSTEPDEFRAMVAEIRTAEKALGQVRYGASPKAAKSRVFRRSLFVVKDIRAGEAITPENVRSIRPAQGLHTRHLKEVLEMRARRDLPAGTPLAWDSLSPK